MSQVLLFCCPYLCNSALGQSDTLYIQHRNPFEVNEWITDTLHYPSSDRGSFLYGTTVVPSTRRMYAANRGYWLDKVVKLPCSGSEESVDDFPPPIIQFTDSTLTIDFIITDNCCYDFLCEIEVNDEGDMRLHTLGYGGYCSCYCCFGMQFQINLRDDRIPLKALYLANSAEPILRFD
jgi:hypothetical protein